MLRQTITISKVNHLRKAVFYCEKLPERKTVCHDECAIESEVFIDPIEIYIKQCSRRTDGMIF